MSVASLTMAISLCRTRIADISEKRSAIVCVGPCVFQEKIDKSNGRKPVKKTKQRVNRKRIDLHDARMHTTRPQCRKKLLRYVAIDITRTERT